MRLVEAHPKLRKLLPADLAKRINGISGIDRPPTIRYRSAMNIKVVVERGEDDYFVAHCPALRSCWSQGKTRDEALQNLREAIALYLEPAPGQVVADERHEVVELA